MKKALIVLGIVLGVIGLAAASAVGYYVSKRNEIVRLDTDIKGRWSQVENQLQRRLDLIPNLVETVKGLAAQERAVIEAIANARARIQGARDPQSRIAAENELSSALSRLLVIVENYPQIRSSAGFIRLMDELAGTENRIAVERKRYNDAVQAYNATIRQFPGNLVADSAGFKEHPFFEAPPAAKEAPKVKF